MTFSLVTVDGVDLGFTPKEPLRPGDTFEHGGVPYKVVCLKYQSRWSETHYDKAELTACSVVVEATLPC